MRKDRFKSRTVQFLVLIAFGCWALSLPDVGQSMAQSLVYERITSEGIGDNVSAALQEALVEAVAQVNGTEVAEKIINSSVRGHLDTVNVSHSAQARSSVQHTQQSVAAVAVAEDANGSRAEAIAAGTANGTERTQSLELRGKATVTTRDFVANKTVSTLSKETFGVVHRYQIISTDHKADGWHVLVLAEIAKYKASDASQRLKIAVLPFRLTRNDQNTRIFEAAFRSRLVEQLTQANKLAVLDRAFSEEQQGELDFLNGNGVKKEELARLGNKLGADFILVGVINDASVRRQKATIQSIGKTVVGPPQASADIAYRIIETATGVVQLADSWRSHGFSAASLEKLATVAADRVSKGALEALFPIRVERVAGGVFYLGQGGTTLANGQRLELVELGQAIVDSYTHEVIGREETDRGTIEIFDVQPRFAKARIVGNLTGGALPQNASLIARPKAATNARQNEADVPNHRPLPSKISRPSAAKDLLQKNEGNF